MSRIPAPTPCKVYGHASKLVRATNKALRESGATIQTKPEFDTPVTTDTMYYVVTKGFADTMNGERSSKSSKGSIYAAFSAEWKAHNFIQDRKLRMVAKVVTL